MQKFIAKSSELFDRFDPKYVAFKRRAANFRYPAVKMGSLLSESPEYGAGEAGIERVDEATPRYIRITDIDENGCLNVQDAKYIHLSEENRAYLLKRGDLLVARTGATYGKTLYIPNDAPAVYASFLIKITLDENVMTNRFYWHFAQSSLYWEQANRLVSTGGQPQFNAGAIRRILVPVPPLDEQRRIVAVLDHFDALCNDLTAGLPAEIEARRKQYEYYRDKLLSFKELDA